MTFERYIRSPVGNLRSFSQAPHIPKVDLPRSMNRIVEDFALEIANTLVDKADFNACGTLLYNFCQEDDWRSRPYEDMVNFAVCVAVMNSAEERSTDVLRHIRKITDNTCSIWRAKMAIQYQSKLDERDLSDRELRSSKDILAKYEDIVDSLEEFMRSRHWDTQLGEIEDDRGGRRGGRDDHREDRFGRGRDRDDRDDRRGRGSDRDDRPVRGFGRERVNDGSGIDDGGVRNDRFANSASRREEPPRDRYERDRSSTRDNNEAAQTVQKKESVNTALMVFPNVPSLPIGEQMKREDHELIPKGTDLGKTPTSTEDVLYRLFKESPELGVSNQLFKIQPGYIVAADVSSLQKSAQAQFQRAVRENSELNTQLAYGCATHPMLGLKLNLDPEKVSTLKQFKVAYTAALEESGDKRMAASGLRQLDRMMTKFVMDFLRFELNLTSLKIDSFFEDSAALSMRLHQKYGKPQVQQYRDFEDRLLTFLALQDDGLTEEAKKTVDMMTIAGGTEDEIEPAPFFIAPLLYSFTHVNLYSHELTFRMNDEGVHFVDPKIHPGLFARFGTISVHKAKNDMKTIVDYLIDLDGTVYRWFESAIEKSSYYIVKP